MQTATAHSQQQTNTTNTYINQSTHHKPALKPPNKPISSTKPTFKQMANTHVTKNSTKPTAKSTDLNQQTNTKVTNHSPTILPIFKVESGSEGARISVGYKRSLYSCMRTFLDKESLVTADRKSTFS